MTHSAFLDQLLERVLVPQSSKVHVLLARKLVDHEMYANTHTRVRVVHTCPMAIKLKGVDLS
jgi:hypothetical protein